MTITNPFIVTVTKKEVIGGEKILSGGTTLKIDSAHNNFLHLRLDNTGMGLTSLRDLADILNEICDVMKENEQ